MIRIILFILFILLLLVSLGFVAYKSKTYFDGLKYGNNKKLERNEILREYARRERTTYGNEALKKLEEEKQKKLEEIEEKYKSVKSPSKIGLIAGLSLSIASLVCLIFIPGSFHQVNTGEVAVVRHLGKIKEIRTPGTYFDFYMVNKYEYYDTKVQQDKILTAAYSKDGQTMELEVFLQYQVQSENIMEIATQYGSLDALQARIETVTIEKTKAVMSSAEAMTIIQNRAQFSNDVSTTVRAGISEDYYVNVKDVVLTNIDFTDEFEKSVENKVIAEQDKQAAITKAEADLEVAKLEAQKKIEQANGDAEAQIILATAAGKSATAKIVELARTLGYTTTETETGYDIDITTGPGADQFKKVVEDYLQYLMYLDTWNGELPNVVAGNDAISIIVPNS